MRRRVNFLSNILKMASMMQKNTKGVRIAVQGCCHGALNRIYASINEACKVNEFEVDLLIITGDFQAVRNDLDLNAMSVPLKYRHMGDFYEYYNGTKVAPIPTIIIGGNHEASNYMWELFHGGWLAPNMYYLGAASVVNFGGIRIAGLSGIYNHRSYRRGHTERLPYSPNDIKTSYHVRAYDVLRLYKLTGNIDIFTSHDWPLGIEYNGNTQQLFKIKPYFRSDSEKGELGSPPAKTLLYKLKPSYWYASHMHVKFAATVQHKVEKEAIAQANPDELDLDEASPSSDNKKNDDEIDLDGEDLEKPAESTKLITPSAKKAKNPSPTDNVTRFLALDKCLPGKDFLQFFDIQPRERSDNVSEAKELCYDPEWLAISKVFNEFMPNEQNSSTKYMNLNAQESDQLQKKLQDELLWVKNNIQEKGKLVIPNNFIQTAPPQYDAQMKSMNQPPAYKNPQTEEYCKLLEMENKITP